MIYDKKDVDAILDYIQKQYGMSSVYHINTDKSIAENTQEMSYQLIKAVVAFDILKQIKDRLQDIEKIDISRSSLDIPTQCNNCFAKRDNGVCWVCAFTGDMSDSGFFQKYDVMENCPFLTQKKIDDLTYDFLHEIISSSYQDFIDDLDDDWRDRVRINIQQSMDDLFGGDGISD